MEGWKLRGVVRSVCSCYVSYAIPKRLLTSNFACDRIPRRTCMTAEKKTFPASSTHLNIRTPHLSEGVQAQARANTLVFCASPRLILMYSLPQPVQQA